ncbi:hypothetical protein FB567DRAFT_517449 [Paraphoma chrysanthemicola]|uniref:Heterokaryon incompatibility domain-containing protein n=1 Tax=Paraphoma chrysanthemicola TaxID=798071 RepID=A0A8K0REC1_9PLEO|nr:hypothetical protein FB567DRAFT_517449 [Paraphoma chrysanthemicola]
MTVCEQLQERYLWVDKMCIVQDDVNDKNRQINAIGQISSSARLVIIAAHGDEVESGLPGVGYS